MTDGFRTFATNRGDTRQRLDLTLCRHLSDVRGSTRTRLQKWIEDGRVTVNGTAVRRVSARVAAGDVVRVLLPPPTETAARDESPRSEAAFEILYEDDSLLAVDKPAGVVVHPTFRNTTGTLTDALLHRRVWGASQRPSIVGRLDKLTTGIVVVAKTAAAHTALQRAMTAKDARKIYLAAVYGRVKPRTREIDLPLRRDARDRRRGVVSEDGAPSLTLVERLSVVAAPRAGLSLVQCTIATGRTHQIRVHLAACGWPIVGDPVYGEPRWSQLEDLDLAATLSAFSRQALHSWRLSLTHPVTRARLDLEAPLPDDLKTLLGQTGLKA